MSKQTWHLRAALAMLPLVSLIFAACTRLDPDRPGERQAERGKFLLDGYHSNPALIDQAEAAFREAIRLDPRSPKGYVGISRVLGFRGDFQAELTEAQQTVERFPKNAEAQLQLGIALGDTNFFSDAIAAFDAARRLDPACEHLDVNVSWTWTQMGEHAKAVEAARRAVAREPRYAWGYRQLGESLLAAGKTEEAVEPFQRASALDPSDPWGYKRLSDAYNSLDRYADALAVLEKAVARFPQNLVLLIDFGTCLQKNDRMQDATVVLAGAEKVAKENIAKDDKDVQSINSLGVAQEYQGKLQAARESYGRILKLTPEGNSDHTLALRNIANTLVKSGQYDDAVGYYRQAYASSKEPDDLRLISFALSYAGKNAEALAQADKWLSENDPASHTGRYMAIHAYLLALSLHDKADPAKYLGLAQRSSDPAWPAPCVEYLAGKLSDADLLAKAADNNQQTEARTYIGFKQVYSGNDAGLAQLQWVAKNGTRHYTETDEATAYLQRRGK